MARPTPPVRSLRARGVSLVEAMVAMAVMSIGMLALVGVQVTMRLNSDLAKQRSEATRIASDEIESLRSFVSVQAVPGVPGVAYADIASRTLSSYTPPNAIGNTSYQVTRSVNDVPGSAQKLITVQVAWVDRTGAEQTVTLDSGIAGVPPTLAAMLTVPHRESGSSRRFGRQISIPLNVDQVNGESRFLPPGTVNVGWFFNNVTGEMQVCTADRGDCVAATLVTGTVRYHTAATQPTIEQAEEPQGPALALAAGPGSMALVDAVGNGIQSFCYADQPTAAQLAAGAPVPYYCAMVTADTSGWGGQLNPVPVAADGTPVAFGNTASTYKSCRYTTDLPAPDNPDTTGINELDAHAEFTLNVNHPRKYCLERPRNANESGLACTGRLVKSNLINQNFLVIRGDMSCPREPEDGAGSPLVNGNTRQHQPAPGA